MSLITALSYVNGISLAFAATMLFVSAFKGSPWLVAGRTAQAVALTMFAAGFLMRAVGLLNYDQSQVYLRGVAVTVFLSIAWTSIADILYERRMEAQACRLSAAIDDQGS